MEDFLASHTLFGNLAELGVQPLLPPSFYWISSPPQSNVCRSAVHLSDPRHGQLKWASKSKKVRVEAVKIDNFDHLVKVAFSTSAQRRTVLCSRAREIPKEKTDFLHDGL